MIQSNSALVFFAETNGFKRCFPWKEFGDGSPRWLFGGAFCSENDVAGLMREKIGFNSELRQAFEKFEKKFKKGVDNR